MAADRRQIEETAASELKRLGESLRSIANGVLLTTEADTAAATARMSALLRNAWLRPLVVGLSLFLGFSAGSWALTRSLSARIQNRIEALAVLDVQIEEARETLAEMEDTTWGVNLMEVAGERFVILPAGAPDHPLWNVDGRPALKLSSE